MIRKKTINVLSIEDNPGDARLIQEKLADAQRIGWDLPRFNVIWVNCLAEGVAYLEAAPGVIENSEPDVIDVVLTDLDLPNSQASETFATLRARFPHLPMVVLTGREDEELARTSVRAGAQDYLFKDEATGTLLAHALIYAIERQESARALQKAHDELEQRVAARTEELRETNEELRAEIEARKEAEAKLHQQNAFLETLLDTIPAPIFYKNAAGRYTGCNKAFEEFIGRDRQEIIAKNVYDMAPPEIADKYAEKDAEILRKPGQQRYEWKVRDAEDQLRDVIFDKASIVGPQGQPEGLIGVITDITDRKQVEEALQASEKKYRLLIENLSEGIWYLDENAFTTFVNPSMAEMLGYTIAEMQGKHLFDFMDARGITIAKHYLERRQQGVRERHEFEFVRKDGTRIYARLSTSPIIERGLFQSEGVYRGAIASVQDITAHKRMEAALQEKHQQLLGIIRHSPNLINLMDTQGRYLLVSRATAELLGCSEADLVGKTFAEVLDPETAALFMERVQTVLETQSMLQTEDSISAPDGEHAYTTTLFPLFDSQGEIYAIGGIAMDITSRKQAEEALRESESRLRAILRYTPVIIYLKDTEGHFTLINRAFEQAFGVSQADIIGKTSYDLVPADMAAEHQTHDERVKQAGKPLEFEESAIEADGQQHIALSIKFPMYSHEGELYGVGGISADITARKQAEQEVTRYAAKLERSNEDLQHFAYVISHDLKEPLRMVKSFLGLLQRGYADGLDADANEYIDFAMDGAERMDHLIDVLLNYARVASQGKEPVPTEAEESLKQTLQTLHLKIEECGATLTYDRLPTVLADPTQLGQLFQNLIENALKFHDEEPPRIHISAVPFPHSPTAVYPSTSAYSASPAYPSTSSGQASAALSPSLAERGKGPGDGGFCTGEGGGMWRFSVRDNGIGIAPKDQTKLFKIFQRLHTREEYEGSGIGLATCKKIVERHGGQIWVESDEGEGATFYFTLPGV